MLLAVDIGNTQTVIGLFSEADIIAHWRIATEGSATKEQHNITLKGLLDLSDYELATIKAVILSSVVPTLTQVYKSLVLENLRVPFLNVNSDLTLNMPVSYLDPKEIGPDRIANGVGVKALYGFPAVVVDFGTATTFDVIDSSGCYLGGVIIPGVEVSLNALIQNASRLTALRLTAPKKVIGENTKQSINSGMIYGTTGQVDYLIKKITAELGYKPKIIATGGLAKLIAPYCKSINKVDTMLTLKGLQIIYEMNLEKHQLPIFK